MLIVDSRMSRSGRDAAGCGDSALRSASSRKAGEANPRQEHKPDHLCASPSVRRLGPGYWG